MNKTPAIPCRGFTLIELLVVVIIVSVITSIALLSFNWQTESALNKEARRFVALGQLAAQEAIISGREIAIEVSHEGYRFLTLDETTWTALNDATFKPHNFDENIIVDIAIDGTLFSLDQELDQDDALNKALDTGDNEDKIIAPRIFLLSSGEATPFELRLSESDGLKKIEIQGSLNGEIKIIQDNDV